MKKKPTNKKPIFIKKLDLSFCIPGWVYNIYNCQKCIIENEENILMNIKECIHLTKILIKYKQCPCGADWWGINLKATKTCNICNPYISKSKLYYRLKIFKFKSNKNLSDTNKWDCHNRGYCLESTFKKGANIGIACKECPFYEGNPI